MHAAHVILLWVYGLAPVVGLVWTIKRPQKHSDTVAGALLGASLFFGLAINTAYGRLTDGRPLIVQSLLTAYFVCSLIVLLSAFNAGVRWLLRWMLRLPETPGPSIGEAARNIAEGLVRAAMIICVGLPFLAAAVMTFRPKLGTPTDAVTTTGTALQDVDFIATDGEKVAGWWMPASEATSDRTVLLCHGISTGRMEMLPAANQFAAAGFNVLLIDERAHGESGGQFASFGVNESLDVLAAVHWLRSTQAAGAHHIYGVGIDTGAAALITAAASDNEDGRAIDALAVYGSFDSMTQWSSDVVRRRSVLPMNEWLLRIILPMASVNAGADLMHYSPAQLIDKIAPRPIFFIQGTKDGVTPFERGQSLYNATSQPKYRLWMQKSGHKEVLDDEDVSKLVTEFFRDSISSL